jgi:hypothetical protein
MDYEDMYDKMDEAQENYPEFIQLLSILPNPYKQSPGGYNNKTEFDTETNFWQDLKKPVIPYVQLTINKTVLQKAKNRDSLYFAGKRNLSVSYSVSNIVSRRSSHT